MCKYSEPVVWKVGGFLLRLYDLRRGSSCSSQRYWENHFVTAVAVDIDDSIEWKCFRVSLKKHRNCGTQTTDVLASFFDQKPRNFNANPPNILVHLQLLNVYQFKLLLHLLPFGRNLKVALYWTPNLRVRGDRDELAGRELCQSKAHSRLPNTSQNKVLL